MISVHSTYTICEEQNRTARFDRYIQDEYSGVNSKPYLSLSNIECYSYVQEYTELQYHSLEIIQQKIFH